MPYQVNRYIRKITHQIKQLLHFEHGRQTQLFTIKIKWYPGYYL